MRTVLYVSGLLVIYGVCIYCYLRASRNRALEELHDFAATVPAPLTDDVRKWLAPQLRRRTVYPFVGVIVGIGVGNSISDGWELPWILFAILLSAGIGGTVGSMTAGFRTTPLIDGPSRMADPARRRLSDFLTSPQVLLLRLAVAISVVAAVLASTVAASDSTVPAHRALVGCGIGAVLVIADYWVAARVASRPLVTSTVDGLLWQKALIVKTVETTPRYDFLVATFGAVMALYVTVLSYDELPAAVLALAVGLGLLTAVSVGGALLQAWRDRDFSDAPRERVRP